LSGYKNFKNEPSLITIELLVAEVNMWRSRADYEGKIKASVLANITSSVHNTGDQLLNGNN